MLDDARWGDDPRERDDNSRDLSRGSRGGSDPRERERTDPRDVFMDHVDLPRGLERLRDEDANIHRVVLENDLKREYQEFLQERNRDRDDSDGRPDRDLEEIQTWARDHDLPCDERGHVQFPDVRESNTTSTAAITLSISK